MSTILPPQLLQRVMPGESWSRREFLRASLVGAAGLLISAKPQAQTAQRAGRVLVIGAGLAGLSCAYELRHAGFAVTVLEARRRVGGRVLSTTLVDHRGRAEPVELGGELIGLQHAVWGTYAHRFGLSLVDVDDHDTRIRVVLGGQLLSEGASLALGNEVAHACTIMNADAAGILADRPWVHANADALDRLSVAEWLRKIEVSARAKAYLANYFGTLNGVDVSQQSYLAHLAAVAGGGLAAYWTDSEQLRCKNGSQALARSLLGAIGQGNVKLGCPVVRIEHRPGHCEAKTADGRAFAADAVVLATPPTTWQQITLSPGLPPAIAPQVGDAVKCIMAPQAPFWENEPQSIADNAVCATWSTPNQLALVCFSGGAAAQKARGQTPLAVSQAYDQALKQIYPTYAAEAPKRTIRMDWREECFSRGGYSVPAPGSVTRQGPLLEQGHDGLYIAGEHGSPSFWGYMEGALRSGTATAARIVNTTSGLR